jgi:hypothetical protein
MSLVDEGSVNLATSVDSFVEGRRIARHGRRGDG